MKIIHFAVVAMVSLVVISGLMIPMTSAFADEIHSVEINEAVRYSLAETDDKVEIEIINGIGYINNETVKDEYGYRMMMFSDSFIVMYDVANEPNGSFVLYSVADSTGTRTTVKSMIAESGIWTATSTDNAQITGEYEWLMAWNKNGNYGAVSSIQNIPLYVNYDATIFACGATSATSMFLKSGTINNLSDVINIGTENTLEITSEQYTTEPNVMSITGFSSNANVAALFVPIKYDVITSMDVMTKTIITLSPLFMGIALFAAMGMGLVRMNKFD